MKYIRFGEIPKSGKSVNYLKLTSEQNEDFTYECEAFSYEEAIEHLPSECFEDGISVFEMDEDKLPRLNNMQLMTSLLARIDDVAYEVEGEEISRGNDGEPLIKVVEVIKKRRINKDKVAEKILDILLKSFRFCEYDTEHEVSGLKIHHSFVEYKVNRKSGEKRNRWTVEGDEWVLCPGRDEYSFGAWTFADPVSSFDVELGYRERR